MPFMPVLRLFSAIFLALLLLAPMAAAQTPPNTPTPPAALPTNPKPLLSQPIFRLGEVVPGLVGYALTAGADNLIERFPVRVESVLRAEGQDFPTILLRASGPFIERVGGIAAGMSGSPVYLRDPTSGTERLAGAIGFAFPFGDHNLALATPIEVMLGAWTDASSASRQAPSILGNAKIFGQPLALAAPLTLTGFSARAGLRLQALLARRGIRAQLVTGANSNQPRPYRFEPGAAISVQLVTGDVALGAVGTVTVIEGGRFLAFGHPMLGQRGVRYAVTPAYVNAIIASLDTPFKLAESLGGALGAIVSDLPYGIAGVLGSDAQMLPIELSLGGALLKNNDKNSPPLKFALAQSPTLAPELLQTALISALDKALGGHTAGGALLEMTVEFRDRAALRLRDRLADREDVAALLAARASLPLAALLQNPFQAVNISKITLKVELTGGQAARLVSVEPEKRLLKPGQMLALKVKVQPWREPLQTRRLLVRIPANAASGLLSLRLRAGLTSATLPDGNPTDDLELLFGAAGNLGQLLERLRDGFAGDVLLVEQLGAAQASAPVLLREVFPYALLGEIDLDVEIE
jgi:hypothetical protein